MAAYGAALLAVVGVRQYPSMEAACETAIAVTGRTSPGGEQAKAYRQGYPIYREMYPALKSSFGGMANR